MDFKDFTARALETESHLPVYGELVKDPLVLGQVLGLLETIYGTGEKANAMKRALYYGKGDIAPEPDGAPARKRQLEAAQTDQFRRMLHAVLGLASELEEKAEILFWMLNNGGKLKPLPDPMPQDVLREQIDFTALHAGEEFGDDAWYAALWADAAGFDPDAALEKVLAKLARRHGKKFNQERVAARDVDNEARALAEGGAQ